MRGYLVLGPFYGPRVEPTVEPVEILGREGDEVRILRQRGDLSYVDFASPEKVAEDLEGVHDIPIVLPDDPLVGANVLLVAHLKGGLELGWKELGAFPPEELLRAYLVGLRHPEVAVSLEAVEVLGEKALGLAYALALEELADGRPVGFLVPQREGKGARVYRLYWVAEREGRLVCSLEAVLSSGEAEARYGPLGGGTKDGEVISRSPLLILVEGEMEKELSCLAGKLPPLNLEDFAYRLLSFRSGE